MVWLVLFILGLCFGSFLNVVIYRLPKGESLLNPPSHCPQCEEPIKWYDNIPVLSFIFLKGKCRHCGKKISLRYPAVEILTAFIFSGSYYFTNETFSLSFFLSLFFLSILLVLAFIDLDTFLIPDRILLPSIFFSLGFWLSGFLFPRFKTLPLLPGLPLSALLAAFLAFLFLYFLAYISPFLFGKEGMGGGDIKLSFFLGLYLGYYVFVALFFAFLIGSLVGLGWVYLKGKDKKEEVPFGPFLALGGALALFFGQPAVSWYLKMIGF